MLPVRIRHAPVSISDNHLSSNLSLAFSGAWVGSDHGFKRPHDSAE